MKTILIEAESSFGDRGRLVAMFEILREGNAVALESWLSCVRGVPWRMKFDDANVVTIERN